MRIKYEDTRLLDKAGEEGSPGASQTVGEEDTVSDDILSMWNEFADDSDDDLIDAEVEQEEVVEPPTAVEQQAEEEEVTPPVEPMAEEVQPQPTAEEVEQVQPEVEKPKVPTQEEVKADIQQKRETALAQLKEHFKLTEEQATQLLTAPQEVLPDIMAKLYMDVYDSVVHGMSGQLPTIIKSVTYQEQQRQAGRKMFYDSWPKLDPVKHGNVVGKYAQMYSSMHPNATAEEVIRDVGTQVMFALKIPVDAPQQQQEVQQASQAHAFRPAGSGRQAGSAGVSDNIFTQMAEEDDFD
jgi:hypothetical protein